MKGIGIGSVGNSVFSFKIVLVHLPDLVGGPRGQVGFLGAKHGLGVLLPNLGRKRTDYITGVCQLGCVWGWLWI